METWSPEEEKQIARVMATETMHDPACQGCRSCDDVSTRESCHRLCSRSEAIRRMRPRTANGVYVVRDADRRIYARELRRWPKGVLTTLRIEAGSEAPL